MNFQWGAANIEHIACHQVTPAEAEEVFFGLPLQYGAHFRNGEERWSIAGLTSAGRVLFVVYTFNEGVCVW